MALNPQSLSSAIVANLGALGSDSSEADAQFDEGAKKLADAIAQAVVKALTTEAQVIIPAGAIQTAGSPASHTSVSPAIGQIT